MIVGDRSHFAIESDVSVSYERKSFRALGFFVIYLQGRLYGVKRPEATMMAASFDNIADRIASRGRHTAPFAAEPSAANLAKAFRDAVYAPQDVSRRFFGMSCAAFSRFFGSHGVLLAPDGDEAFDDGSYILQFDVDDMVRLIGFKCTQGEPHDAGSLTDLWMPSAEYYSVLQRWRDGFFAEWTAAEKTPENMDGAE